jgi:hypothetical protein
MTRLIRAELLKLSTIRVTWALLAGAAALIAAVAGAVALVAARTTLPRDVT